MKGGSSKDEGVTVLVPKIKSPSLHRGYSSSQQYLRALLLLIWAFLLCSAPRFLNALQTLKKQWKISLTTQTLSFVLQILQSFFVLSLFFLLEQYKEEFLLLFYTWEWVEKAQFSFCLHFVCMRQTRAVCGASLTNSSMTLTLYDTEPSGLQPFTSLQ